MILIFAACVCLECLIDASIQKLEPSVSVNFGSSRFVYRPVEALAYDSFLSFHVVCFFFCGRKVVVGGGGMRVTHPSYITSLQRAEPVNEDQDRWTHVETPKTPLKETAVSSSDPIEMYAPRIKFVIQHSFTNGYRIANVPLLEKAGRNFLQSRNAYIRRQLRSSMLPGTGWESAFVKECRWQL